MHGNEKADVTIFEAGGKYHVRPATFHCSANATTVTFRNFTKKRARVWLPAMGVQTEAFNGRGSLELPPGGVRAGVYEYAVSIEDVADGEGASWFAEGESAPRMIFE